MAGTRVLFLLTWLCRILLGCCSGDNSGNEYIITYTENVKNDNSLEKAAPVYPLEMFILPSGASPVTVNVTAPSFSSYQLSHQITVKNDDSVKLEVDISLQLAGNEQSSKGIHVQASGGIVLLIINRQKYTSDGYLALPLNALGTEYYAVTEFPDDHCQFAIVATQDGTVVDIKLSNNANAKPVQFGQNQYQPGDQFQVSLDKYGTVQIQSTGDLTGSRITSNKPITFLSGNRRTVVKSGISSDHLVEQLFSVDKWGKTYSVVPIPQRPVGDYFKVVASEDSTLIQVACLKDADSYDTSVSLASAGDFEMLHISPGRYCSFISNHAIMVVQFVLSQSSNSDKHDPSMILIAPREQYMPGYIFTTPRIDQGSYENFLMLIIPASQKTGLRLDGNELPSNTNFQDIPGTNLTGCYIIVTDGYHHIHHVSPIAAFSGILYGRAKYESYGVSVGLRLGPANLPCTPTASVDSDGIDNDCDGLVDEELCTAENSGADDDGDGVSDEDCVLPYPVDGIWTEWSEWQECSITCSDSKAVQGTKTRQRNCTEPMYGGDPCSGSSEDTASCTSQSPCPVDGNWGTWTAWGDCSMTCNPYQGSDLVVHGTQTRSRTCTNPSPQHGGNPCDGDSEDSGLCQKDTACPDTNGNWGAWEEWSDCLRFRFRSCDNPAPSPTGQYCVGPGNDSSTCDVTSPVRAVQNPATRPSCDCPVLSATTTTLRPVPTTPGNMAIVMEQLNRELRRDRKNLSKYKRSLGSASDSRQSSMLIGSVIAFIIVAIMAAFLIMDLEKIYRFLRDQKDEERDIQ
ncbi:uncharacterized protein LOC117341914 [Pecten maximus]|uniref:uncharacterized protein LOC117341914 n=1 Tax=Pecten maximus TaxID=6579 RepID=UPI001458A5CE|nr:uncharacterized protein LOC117341914 [Pecten maximus]